jgi:nitroreductase
MTIFDAIKNRRSIRDFKDQDIPEEAVDALIEAIRWAPSAGNLQSRKFYFILIKMLRSRRAALNQHFIAQAHLRRLPDEDRAHYGDRGVNLYSIQMLQRVMNMMPYSI